MSDTDIERRLAAEEKGIDLDNDPIIDPDLKIEPDLTPEEEEQVGFGPELFGTDVREEQMPAEASVEDQYELAEESVELDSEDEKGDPYNGPEQAFEPVVARLLIVGSAEWEVDATVHMSVIQWAQRKGVTDLILLTSGCPTGAEAAARTGALAHMARHVVIRDEDIHRSGIDAALFFIRDQSEGAENLLGEVLGMRVPVTVYREERTINLSPWQNR